MTHDEEYVPREECKRVHNGLDELVNKIEKRLDRVDNRMLWAIALILSNLIAIIVTLVRQR